MSVQNLIWLIILIIYILSPWDLHPFFIDDLIALGLIYFIIYKYKKRLSQNQRASQAYYRQQKEKEKREDRFKNTRGSSLYKAYAILELTPEATTDAIKKAYKEKIAKNHPDKVSHLSNELQEKAKEMTILINEAYELIKKDRKF